MDSIYIGKANGFLAQDILELGPERFNRFVHLMAAWQVCYNHPFGFNLNAFAISETDGPALLLSSYMGYRGLLFAPKQVSSIFFLDLNFGHIVVEASVHYPDSIQGLTLLPQDFSFLSSVSRFGDVTTITRVLDAWDNFNRNSGLLPESTWAYDLAVASWVDHFESQYGEMPTEYLVVLGEL